MKINLPKTFSQNDSRWKNSPLGTRGTIGAFGCLMTDATMALNYFKGLDETPLTVNQRMTQNGGFVNSKGQPTPNAPDANLFVWGVFASLYGLKYSGQFSNTKPLTTEQMNQIKSQIDKGYPVLLQIDTIPATSGLDEHWILAIDYDGDDFIVQDPWDGVTKRITSWGVQPQKLIYAWCWYEGKVPSQSQNDNNEQITISVKERDWLVGRASVIKELATFLGFEDPDNTPLDKFKTYLAGKQSYITSLENDKKNLLSDIAKANTEVENQKDKVANVKAECQRQLDVQKAQIDKLNKDLNNAENLAGTLRGTISTLEGSLRDKQKEVGQLQIRISELESQLANGKKQVDLFKVLSGVVAKLLALIRKNGNNK